MTDTRRYLIIANPTSGRAHQRLLEEVRARLGAAGVMVETKRTTRHGQARALAREAAASGAYAAVIAAGGDGTVHDVAAGLVGTSCPLGVVPLGTANVFARELGLPLAAEALVRVLLSGNAGTMPVGDVNGEIFLFVVGVGFDAEAVRHFEGGKHRRFGIGGFVAPVLHALFSDDAQPLRVRIDDAVREANWVIVTRARHYAANLPLAAGADLFDDRLHAVLFTGRGPAVRIRQLAAMMSGLLTHDPGVSIIACRRVYIETAAVQAPVPVQIDGEAKGHLPLDIGIHPDRLRVLLPGSM